MVTDNRTFVHNQAAAWLEQMQVAWAGIRDSGTISHEDFWSKKNPYFARMNRLYEEDFQIASLTDQSDLLLHAEGPGAPEGAPSLGTVSWLSSLMEKRLRSLVEAILPMTGDDAKAAARALDLRLTGLASGSLYMGFAVALPHSSFLDIEESDRIAFDVVRKAVQSLPIVPQFITDTEVLSEIVEAMPDPALRDAAMTAAYEISPTGRKGIHTLDISAPGSGVRPATLGQRERVVLRESMKKNPMMGSKQSGSFTGDLRALDLDLERATLRNVDGGYSSIRCVLRVPMQEVREHFGKTIRVSGEYESSPDGRPRFLRVTSIERARPRQAALIPQTD